MTEPPPLTIADLLVWGRFWEHYESEFRLGRSTSVLVLSIVRQLIDKADAGFALLKQRGQGELYDTDTLLRWRADWLSVLDGIMAGRTTGAHIDMPALRKYIAAANVGLALLLKREKRGQGGRPPGSGPGTCAARLIAHGMLEEHAIAAAAAYYKKDPLSVQKTMHQRRRPRK